MKAMVICRDRPGALQVRLDNRAAHLAWLEASGVELAGPLLDEAGDPCGSVIVVEVPDLATARDWAAGDPYAQAGLFESVTVQGWRRVIG